MVSVPGEVKYPTQGVNACVTFRGLQVPLLEKDNSKNNPVYNTQVWVLTVSEGKVLYLNRIDELSYCMVVSQLQEFKVQISSPV